MEGCSTKSTFADNQLIFVRMLRMAGLPVVHAQTFEYLRTLQLIDIGRRDHVFHAARSLLVTRAQDLALFDAIFEQFWNLHRGPTSAPKIQRPRRRLPRTGLFTSLAPTADSKNKADEQSLEVDDREGSFSPEEFLRRRNFADMNEDELARIRQLMTELRWKISSRRTRRRVADAHGKMLDLHAVVREASRHGGATMRLRYRRRKLKPRPIVVLADISGSMEKYSRLLLQFMYCLSRGPSEVESFVFGTRLTRITSQLQLRNVDRAVEEAASRVIDWSGGTRIGESLATFNRRWSRSVLRRGAIGIIVSDGWERGDSVLLRREMRFLQRRCHRLVWLNPLLADHRYRPLVAGMATALPFVDDFLPVHNMNSLQKLAAHLASLSERRSARRATPLGRSARAQC